MVLACSTSLAYAFNSAVTGWVAADEQQRDPWADVLKTGPLYADTTTVGADVHFDECTSRGVRMQYVGLNTWIRAEAGACSDTGS